MKKITYLTAFLGALCLTNVASGADNDVLGSIGDVSIKKADLQALLNVQGTDVAKKLADNPALLVKLIESETVRKAVVVESDKNGWGKKPNVVYLMERSREQALIDSYLSEMAKVPNDYPKEDEVTQFYKQNATRFKLPPMVHLAQVFLPLDANASAVDQNEASKKLKIIEGKLNAKKADFAEVARKESLDQGSASKGGDMGWLSEAILLPEIKRELTFLAKGSMSKPVRTNSGWHIIKLIETKPESTQALSEAKPAIVDLLRNRKFEENKKVYLENMLKKTPIKVVEPEALKGMFGANP